RPAPGAGLAPVGRPSASHSCRAAIASPKENDTTLAVRRNNRRTRSCGMSRGSALLLGGQANGAVLRGKDEGLLTTHWTNRRAIAIVSRALAVETCEPGAGLIVGNSFKVIRAGQEGPQFHVEARVILYQT